jgi:hypothetical protein
VSARRAVEAQARWVDMPFKGQKTQVLPWKEGLDLITNEVFMDPQRLSQAENVEFGFDGTRIKRGGSIPLNKSPIFASE